MWNPHMPQILVSGISFDSLVLVLGNHISILQSIYCTPHLSFGYQVIEFDIWSMLSLCAFNYKFKRYELVFLFVFPLF
jgi:hypothetical protein